MSFFPEYHASLTHSHNPQNTNTTNKQQNLYSCFTHQSQLTAEFSVIKKTLMRLIKMTVMMGI